MSRPTLALHRVLNPIGCRPPINALLLGLVLLLTPTQPAEAGWQTFHTSDGLPGNWVTKVLEDGHGNLWIAADGLVRFDGLAFEVLEFENGLPARSLSTMTIDRSGNLWVGTFGGGAARYENPGWTIWNTEKGLSTNDVVALFEDSQGRMWFGNSSGEIDVLDDSGFTAFTLERSPREIYEDSRGDIWVGQDGFELLVSRYDGTAWRTYSTGDGLPSGRFQTILEDAVGRIWVGTSVGTVIYDGAVWSLVADEEGPGPRPVSSMLLDQGGNFWVGTLSSLSRFDGTTWRRFDEEDGFAGRKGRVMTEDHRGYLWVGSSEGAYRFDGERWRAYTPEDGLGHDDVEAVLVDHVGNLWFGTLGGGLSRYDGSDLETYTSVHGLAEDTVIEILEDRDGQLWFGSGRAGVTRYDGQTWTRFSEADGLGVDEVRVMLQERTGALWCGGGDGARGAISRFDGNEWRIFGPEDGAETGDVYDIIEDRNGVLWFGTPHGALRYDGSTWSRLTSSDGLPGGEVSAMVEDANGDLWFGTENGIGRFDGTNWTTYNRDDGLPDDWVYCLAEDRDGNIWAGFYALNIGEGGLARFDGTRWTAFREVDGLGSNFILDIVEDRVGSLWFVTFPTGVTRYDGEHWVRFGQAEGLPTDFVVSVMEDVAGSLWLGTQVGAVRYDQDRTAPQTVPVSRPPSVSTGRNQSVSSVAAYGEATGVFFSHSLNDGPWSPWSSFGTWGESNLPDDAYLLRVRSRDRFWNVDPVPAEVRFEIDATAPVPLVSSPSYGAVVQGLLTIEGSADDLRFRSYRLEARKENQGNWTTPAGLTPEESSRPVSVGILGEWDTRLSPDGTYVLRVSVTDTLGLTGASLILVTIDNELPSAEQTAPARVRATQGGHVFSTDARVHLYFPPGAFADDSVVHVLPLNESDVPPTLPDQAVRVLPGYGVSWGDLTLKKPATLEIRLPSEPVEDPPAFYVLEPFSDWAHLGGTSNLDENSLSLPIQDPGFYAIFAGGETEDRAAPVRQLTITPRVFSLRGATSSLDAAISFSLGSPGSVSVTIFNRAGRLVRRVVNGQFMSSGANLIRWDGLDMNGEAVDDGLYIVTVETGDKTQSQTLAVAR